MALLSVTGNIQKLKSTIADTIQYTLPIGNTELPLNQYLGKTLHIKYNHEIVCIYCKNKIKKSYSQGYCFPCSQKLARCDFCIFQPEKCHYHKGTCREPEWGKTHCFIPHIVYLANTSGLKVGITRSTQIPTRWIDQGAIQALPIFRVQNRYQAGLLEVSLKKQMNDKTNWRKMLSSNVEELDLASQRDALFNQYPLEFERTSMEEEIEFLEAETLITLQYPVLEYPNKISSLNFEKTPEVSGTFLGIKGQYLILDIGVSNIRNLTGFNMTFEIN